MSESNSKRVPWSAALLDAACRAAPLAVLVLAAAALPGCGILRSAAGTTGRVAGAVVPGEKKKPPSTENLLPDLFRYADSVSFRVEQASRQFQESEKSPQADMDAARWRLEALRWTTQLAAGPSSIAGLLDLVLTCTASSYMQTDYWIPEVYGEAAQPMLVAHEQSAEDGWQLLERYLLPEHVAEARQILADYRAKNPKLTPESLLQFPSFSALAAERSATATSGGGLMGMVGLNDLSGIEPAVREIEQARQLGMRGLFFAQRATRLIGAEVEVRTLGARDSEEFRQVLADVERITTTLESVAATAQSVGATAASLPAALSTEREAALNQVSRELTVQREGLVADLEQSHETLDNLLRGAQGTLEAGKGMSVELTAALTALDAFVGRFDKPADPNAAPPAEPEPPGKPFDITEYGAAAERIGNAVKELNALVSELDTRLPEAQRLLDAAAERGERSVDHVMKRVLVIGLALIAAAVVGVWVLRRFAPQRR